MGGFLDFIIPDPFGPGWLFGALVTVMVIVFVAGVVRSIFKGRDW